MTPAARRALLLILAAAAVAMAAWAGLPEGAVVDAPPGANASAVRLDASFARATPGSYCGECHYQWDPPFNVTATRRTDGSGGGAGAGSAAVYAVNVSPASKYNLTVFAAPVLPGEAPPPPAAHEEVVRVRGGNNRATVTWEPPWPAAAVLVEARGLDSYRRPDVQLDAAWADATSTGAGSRANKQALLKAPDGSAWEAPLEAGVFVADAGDAVVEVVVRFRAYPAGYRAAGTSAEGAPVTFAWSLPPPGAPGAPGRFHVAVAPFNAHPTERWRLTVNGDASYFEGNATAPGAAPPPANRPRTAAEGDAAWNGSDALLLREERFDGVLFREYDGERGEWDEWSVNRAALNTSACPPTENLQCLLAPASPCARPCAALPPIPPGASEVRVLLEWDANTPASEDPPWLVAVTRRPLPDFEYLEPTTREPGRLEYVIPVGPADWEVGDAGWFQAHPLLHVGGDGRAAFDGAYTFRVDAVRGAGVLP